MEQNNNTKNTTTEKLNIFKDNATWNTTLKDLEEWQIARRNLDKWLDDAETGTFGSFFESKTNRTAPFSLQNLAIICHTSSGYIGDLVRKAKEKGMEKALKDHVAFNEPACYISLILDTLAPNLAEERAKREAEHLAKLAEEKAISTLVWGTIDTVLDMWQELGIEPSFDNILKLCAKYKAKDHGWNIIVGLFDTLPMINEDQEKSIAEALGIEPKKLWEYFIPRPDDMTEKA